MEDKKIYAVDFDGTLSLGEWPQVGEPNLKLFEFLREARTVGHKVILWTCREGNQLEIATEYCYKQGLEFDAVNDNLHENKSKYNNNSRKVFADHYIDDRGVLPEEITDCGEWNCRVCVCVKESGSQCVYESGRICYWTDVDLCYVCRG